MNAPHQSRLAALSRHLEDARLDALVVTHLPNVRYLCAFTGSAGTLLVYARGAVLFTDGRYRTQARHEVQGAGVRIVRGDNLAAAGKHLKGRGRLRAGFEAARLSVAAKLRLGKASGARIAWRGIENWVEELRAVKDAGELVLLRDAAALGSAVFEEVLPLIRPGVRELELAAEMDYRIKRRGASGPSFETIVAFGERTAMPHAVPTMRALRRNELVLLDWGAILRGYCCDLTRTLFVGRAPAEVRRRYGAVVEAQRAAMETLRPGASAEEVDAAARRILRRRRLGRHFVHSTGHGIGLEVHEEPRLAQGQKRRMVAGHVVTLEPGVYLEGEGGIRVEDDAVVTAGGCELLTTATREFLQL